MATTRATVSVKPVWIQFQKGKVKAELLSAGKKLSSVRYVESVDFPTYKAKRGDVRKVWNIFISPRRTKV
jgi:hypothetical protein